MRWPWSPREPQCVLAVDVSPLLIRHVIAEKWLLQLYALLRLVAAAGCWWCLLVLVRVVSAAVGAADADAASVSS